MKPKVQKEKKKKKKRIIGFLNGSKSIRESYIEISERFSIFWVIKHRIIVIHKLSGNFFHWFFCFCFCVFGGEKNRRRQESTLRVFEWNMAESIWGTECSTLIYSWGGNRFKQCTPEPSHITNPKESIHSNSKVVQVLIYWQREIIIFKNTQNSNE